MEGCAVSGCGGAVTHRPRTDVVLCCDHFEAYAAARFNVPDGALVLNASITAAVGKHMYIDLRIQFESPQQGERARQSILNPGALMLPEGTAPQLPRSAV